jgi:hypothetical protein
LCLLCHVVLCCFLFFFPIPSTTLYILADATCNLWFSYLKK